MVNKTHTIARAIGQSARKQQEYAATRNKHTKDCIIDTTTKRGRPPKPKAPQPEAVEALRNRVESVEGSEVPENIINTLGQDPIQDRAEISMQHLFNGA